MAALEDGVARSELRDEAKEWAVEEWIVDLGVCFGRGTP